jgi:glutamyl-tRNA synthetase
MVVTRFAPSPTGYLHIGGLRTALLSYLWARKNNGKFLLRIEDTDLSRNNEDAMKAIVEAFDWAGLDYDGEVVYQSQRFDLYKKYIDQLLQEGKAYKCYMSKEELDALREKQQANGERPRYDGTYRDFDGTPPEGIEPVIRIKAPLEGTISFQDGIKGSMNISADEVDDFIIARSSGVPTYNFVVAIDDALMGLTDVIRGDDHLSNTPKQIVVYNALGFDIPKFYHVPMINNSQGKKLSKRDGAMNVMDYQDKGYLKETLLNFLVRLGWSHGDQEIFSMDEMLELFDPNNINKSASAYNESKLEWLNQHYIKNVSNDRLAKELEFFGLVLSSHDKKEILLDGVKERAKTLKELADGINSIITAPSEYDEKAIKKFIKENTIETISKYMNILKENKESLKSPVDFEGISKPFVQENELKFPQFAQPLRIAIVGSTQSPSIYDVLSVVGVDEVLSRFDKLVEYLNNKGE